MTDTSGPRSDEPREQLPQSSSEDLTRPIPRTEGAAPPVPAGFESGPAGSAGADPAGAGPAGPGPGYPAAGLAAGGIPPAGPPHQSRFPVHPGHRHQLAWVIGGVVVAAITLGTGFVGGFVVGHVVGSHGDGQRVERMAGPGMMNEQGPGKRFDDRQGDGGARQWREINPGNPGNRDTPNLPDPTDVPTPSTTSSTN